MKHPVAMKMKDVDLHDLICEDMQDTWKKFKKKQVIGQKDPNNNKNESNTNNDSSSVLSIYHVPGR